MGSIYPCFVLQNESRSSLNNVLQVIGQHFPCEQKHEHLNVFFEYWGSWRKVGNISPPLCAEIQSMILFLGSLGSISPCPETKFNSWLLENSGTRVRSISPVCALKLTVSDSLRNILNKNGQHFPVFWTKIFQNLEVSIPWKLSWTRMGSIFPHLSTENLHNQMYLESSRRKTDSILPCFVLRKKKYGIPWRIWIKRGGSSPAFKQKLWIDKCIERALGEKRAAFPPFVY